MTDTARQPMQTEPLVFTELPPADIDRRADEFLALMRRRRTVRDFSDRPLPRAMIDPRVRLG